MNSFSKYITLSLLVCGLASCDKDNGPLSANNEENKTLLHEFAITGEFTSPEVVDLESSSDLRAFTLRPNKKSNYPKLVFPGIESGTKGFEPYFSSVWMFVDNDWRQIYVEDNGIENAQAGDYSLGANASSSRIPGAQKGVSRIMKNGDAYRFFVRFSAPSRGSNQSDAWIDSYTLGKNYLMSIAISPNTNGGASWPSNSAHRIYAPVLTNTDIRRTAQNPQVPTLPALKLTEGDYILAQPSADVSFSSQSESTKDNILKIPVISDYLVSGTIQNSTLTTMKTNFRMKGVLLSLKLSNRTGRKIIVKKLKTKSDNLAYSGFYELWKAGQSGGTIPPKTPLFSRASQNKDILQSSVYTFDLQSSAETLGFTIGQDADSQGRLYLWGGIDPYTPSNPSTKCQIIFSYADEPGVDYRSETVELSPKTQTRKFEEGKVYLITVPINKPVYRGADFAYNDFDKYVDDWQ